MPSSVAGEGEHEDQRRSRWRHPEKADEGKGDEKCFADATFRCTRGWKPSKKMERAEETRQEKGGREIVAGLDDGGGGK